MYFQQNKKASNNSIQSILSDFLNHINYNIIHQLPHNNNPNVLAAQTRVGKRVQRLTGFKLMKRNVKLEAERLQLYDQYLINLATSKIWSLRTSRSQRQQFINLANDANNINQNMMTENNANINRISQINNSQKVKNQFEDNFFNGTKFDNNNNRDLESLIFPIGSSRNLGTYF
ncbi:hypothetical protein RhiirA5_423844 [Rhizophagus irregularis]|uniref:Uncharacterized protein n=1 Tax=Rhizophagus irregularis TaxID=588596 RepID=A0A2I1EYX2_9GLOM|nr:hypothetical protein RhiirA5_423844 [Rhizophagus irregularis]PKC60932.1 hypothetical protein RhiirA1_467304 [Rhizophagus irregularis]PKY27308.1 hypothetical protein RhiirB3_442958 [Rhizophagus irregularis]CAB4483419.1 unnamed protein product [Rhizophagus irregularis]CAB5185591.1 unnamed protein product [Rhizophagus irregularis]